jgi:hypothetical protein
MLVRAWAAIKPGGIRWGRDHRSDAIGMGLAAPRRGARKDPQRPAPCAPDRIAGAVERRALGSWTQKEGGWNHRCRRVRMTLATRTGEHRGLALQRCGCRRVG